MEVILAYISQYYVILWADTILSGALGDEILWYYVGRFDLDFL